MEKTIHLIHQETEQTKKFVKKVTDRVIDMADKFIDIFDNGRREREDTERSCIICDDHFIICTRTDFDYRDYFFHIRDLWGIDIPEVYHMEGDFRD